MCILCFHKENEAVFLINSQFLYAVLYIFQFLHPRLSGLGITVSEELAPNIGVSSFTRVSDSISCNHTLGPSLVPANDVDLALESQFNCSQMMESPRTVPQRALLSLQLDPSSKHVADLKHSCSCVKSGNRNVSSRYLYLS